MDNNIQKYKTRTDLLNLVPTQSVFLEIGVFRGEFAKQIIDITNPKELYLVDIWEDGAGSGDKDGKNYVFLDDMEDVYLKLHKQTINNSHVHVIRAKSVSFLKNCDPDYFDAIYIDGDHTEEAVYLDLVNSFPVIKNEGLLMGHDYHYAVSGDSVSRAVTRFCSEYNQTVVCVADDGCPSFLIKVKK